MQLKDLVKPIEDMSDEELLARLQQVREKRTVIRPAAKAHAERAEKKTSRKRVAKTTDLIGSMSEEEKAALIAMLSQPEEG